MSGPLRVVTTGGEVFDDPAQTIQRLQDELAGATQRVRQLDHEVRELIRDREREATEHRAWPNLIILHGYWRELTRRPGAQWDAECFWCALPFYKKYGEALCRVAIAGCAFDHYEYDQKNGERYHCSEWTRIFSPRRKRFGSPVYGTDNFEGFVRKAPRPVVEELRAAGEFRRLTSAAAQLLAEAFQIVEERDKPVGRRKRQLELPR